MASSFTLTPRVSAGLRRRLDRLAQQTRRSKSFLASEAIDAYLDRELAIVEHITRGLDDMRAGRIVPHDEAMRRLARRRKRVTPKAKPRSR